MFLHYMERLFWTAGAAAIGYGSWMWAQGVYAQTRGQFEFRQAVTHSTTPPLREGALFGQIEAPAVGLHAIVFEGTTDTTLTRGVGHLSASARPGGDAGNVVLAGHRDSFFRPLRKIRVGDAVILRTARGSFEYTVESTGTVSPDAVEVLQPTPDSVLTLITCYPFTFIGNAPERYIVRAVRTP